VGYDWHGGYGHPDHVKVHAVVHRAADLAARRPRLLESTMNRDLVRGFYEATLAAGEADQGFNPDGPMDDGNPLGTPASEITWQVDVSDYLPQRRAALEAPGHWGAPHLRITGMAGALLSASRAVLVARRDAAWADRDAARGASP